MPMLKNLKHERFAQNLILAAETQWTNGECYTRAGYRTAGASADVNASKLLSDTKTGVMARVRELLAKFEVSVERLAKEYARIGYGDITDVLDFTNGKVTLKPSKKLSKDVTAAISEVRQTKDGIVIKMHNKVAALDALARHKGMFKENIDLKITVSLADLVNQSYDAPKLVEGKEVEE